MSITKQQIIQIIEKTHSQGGAISISSIHMEISHDNGQTTYREIADAIRSWRERQFSDANIQDTLNPKSASTLLRNKFAEIEKSLSNEIEPLLQKHKDTSENSITNSESNLQELASLVDKLLADNAALSNRLDETAKKNQQQSETLIQKNTEITALQETTKKLQNDSKAHDTNIQKLQNTLKQTQDEKEKLVALNSSHEKSAEHLKQENIKLNSDYQESQRAITELRRTQETATNSQQKSELKAQSAELSLKQSQEQYRELQSQQEQLQAKCHQLEKQAEKLRDDNQTLQTRLATAETKSQSMKKDRDQSTSKIRQLQSSLTETNSNLSDRERTIANMQGQQEHEKQLRDTIREKNEALQQQINTLNTHYDEANKATASAEAKMKRLEEEITSLRREQQDKQQIWSQERQQLLDRADKERERFNALNTELVKIRKNNK